MIDALASEIADAFARRQLIAIPPSARAAGLTLDQAYAVEAELARRRHAAGHATAGRKVGFASKALWRVMGLSTVAWASMYDDTVHHAGTNDTSISIGRMFSPTIEPEIMMKLKAPLGAGVAEPSAALEAVFVGLLQAHPESFLNRQPGFTPSLGTRAGEFRMIDFLTFAGVAERR